MKKLARKWAFRPSMVADAPDTSGLYALWDGDELLYVGHASGGDDTLRARLSAHLARALATSSPAPTHYSWEICSDPRARKVMALAELARAAACAADPETAA